MYRTLSDLHAALNVVNAGPWPTTIHLCARQRLTRLGRTYETFHKWLLTAHRPAPHVLPSLMAVMCL